MTREDTEFQTASEYIAKRLTDGERDADVLAAELLRPRLRGLIAPLIRDYAEGRVRAYVLALENRAGREGGSTLAASARDSAALTPLEARQRLMRESIWIPGGTGFARYADLTVEMIQRRIEYMDQVAQGAMKSVRWLRAVIGAIERNGVRTFGEVPFDDSLFPEPEPPVI